MVVYQKFGVIGSTFVLAALEKLKFQIFRLFIVYDTCRRSAGICNNSTDLPNSTYLYFQDENVSNSLFKSLIVSNASSILPCIFLAAWSDKHGRKALLTLPFVGCLLGDLLVLALLYSPPASRDLLLLVDALQGLFGGPVLIVLGCLCYLTDSTDHRLRTWFIGLLLGSLNFLPVLEMALQCYFTPLHIALDFRTLILIGISVRMFFSVYFLVYVKVFVVESVFVLGTYHGNPWTNLLTPINVSDTVNCMFKRRMDNMRFFIIALCTVFVFYSFVLYGNLTIWIRHFGEFFRWPLQDILIFSGTSTSCQTLTLWISIYSALKWRVLDIELGIYGTLSLAASCITLTFLRNSWLAVMGALIGLPSLLIPASILSVLSKLIERIETGSMFAGIGFLMLLSQSVSIPSYRALYEVCAEAGLQQVTFLLSFGFATFGMLFFIYLKKHIAPDLLGHLNGSESLALVSRKTEFEHLFQ